MESKKRSIFLKRALPRRFYERRTDIVARALLGNLIIRNTPMGKMAAVIVETEAYFGNGTDPASHAFNGPTPRSAIMFGRPGIAYVYFNYGVHWLLNFVAKEEGEAGAVLVRAVEPVAGIDLMYKNRKSNKSNLRNKRAKLTSGPAKLTSAMGINRLHNGMDVTKKTNDIYVTNGLDKNFSIEKTKRVGINKGKEKELRFYVKNNVFVSLHKR